MKNIKYLLIFVLSIISIFYLSISIFKKDNNENSLSYINNDYNNTEINPIVKSARKQIGVVIKYDTGYYEGGYPPEDRGACIDVISRALLDNGYNLKSKIDEDFKNHPERYEEESDPNINYRRVKNVKIFFDNYATNLTTEINENTLKYWQPGDIITYDKMVGGLWHIVIISDKKDINGIPFLIHNHGFGTTENNLLLKWPAKISGHYRIEL